MRRFWLYGLPLYTYALGVFTTEILRYVEHRAGYKPGRPIGRLHP